jgi:dsDNA-specific endonuclease/ATPase MutS2
LVIFDFVLKRLRRKRLTEKGTKPPTAALVEDEDESFDPNNPFPEIVTIEFRDVIDLHSIPPKQTRAVVEDYIEEARRRRVRFVRIIHGKGIGVQREIVRSILERTPWVVDFRDAPAETGGWGATLVTLSIDDNSSD